MNTQQLIQQAGLLRVVAALILALTTVLLQILALPLAAGAIWLDKAATLTASPLTSHANTIREARYR